MQKCKYKKEIHNVNKKHEIESKLTPLPRQHQGGEGHWL